MSEALNPVTELNKLSADVATALATYDGVDVAKLGAHQLGIQSKDDPAFVGICNNLGIAPSVDTLEAVGQTAIVSNSLRGISNPLLPTTPENQSK